MSALQRSLTTTSWEFLDTSGGDNKDQNPNYHCLITCSDMNIQIKANLPQDFAISIGAQYEEALAQAMNSSSVVSELAGKARLAGVQLVTQALTAQVWQGSTEISFSLPLTLQVNNDETTDVLKPLSDLYTLCLPDEVTSGGFLKAPGPTLSVELLKKSTGAFVSGVMNVAGEGAKDALTSLKDSATSFVNKALPNQYQLSTSDSKSADAPGKSNVQDPTSEGQSASLSSAIKNNISLTIGQYMHFDSVVITNVDQTHHVQPLENGTMSRVDVTVTFKTFFVPTRKDIGKIFLGLAKTTAPGLSNPRSRN